MSAPFVTAFDVESDLVTSLRAYWDQLGFMVQLGLMPGSYEPKEGQ